MCTSITTWYLMASSGCLCVIVGIDEAFDDEELLELAQAGRSQTDQHDTQPWQQQQVLTTGAAPSSNKPGREQDEIGQAKASGAELGTEPAEPVSAAENAEGLLEMDDDELLELACGSFDPQQNGAVEWKQPSQLTPSPPSEDKMSPRTGAGDGTTGESLPNSAEPPGRH